MKAWFEKYRYWINVPAMTMLGMFLLVAGVSKLFYQSGSFSAAPFIESLPLVGVFFVVLPYIEIALGLLLVNGVAVKFAATLTGAMVAQFATSNIILITMGKGFELCDCFGMAGRLTYLDALIIDGIMAFLVAVVLVCHRGRYFNRLPWFLEPLSLIKTERSL